MHEHFGGKEFVKVQLEPTPQRWDSTLGQTAQCLRPRVSWGDRWAQGVNDAARFDLENPDPGGQRRVRGPW